jgi:hypothetical protein
MASATSSTATVATPSMPQTTVEPAGGPFVRYSEPGKARIYYLTSLAFGGLVNQPLVAIPGYAARFRIQLTASGGVNVTSTTVGFAADAPENAVQLITLWDALGTPIVSGPGYEVLRLVPMFSGGFGLDISADTHNLPSYTALVSGSSGTGNFKFSSCIPLEFSKGYGVLGMADGDVLPKLQVQFNGSASVYTTAPITTVPSLELRLNADYYWLPVGSAIAPPGLGTTRQWFLQQGNPTIGSAGTTTVTIPRQGGWLDTIIFILRDANSVRIDQYPTILRFALDGIGEISTNIDEIYDDMAIAFSCGALVNGATNIFARPTGVICLTRKTSLGQKVFGLFDTYEVALSTSPGTSMTVEGAPWGTISSAPGTLSCLLGQVIPSGALIQGLAEL